MSEGVIQDPIYNPIGKGYGFLIEECTGHHFLYIKDKRSQYLPHGTPVTFDKLVRTVQVTDIQKMSHDVELELAVITGLNKKCLKENGFVVALLPCIKKTDWEGKTQIEWELMSEGEYY